MLRLIAIIAMLGLSGCISTPAKVPVAAPVTTEIEIGAGARLTLPAKPDYPETLHLSQLITATYDGAPLRVQSELNLGSDLVSAALSPLGGPPVMTIQWTSAGIEVDKGAALPDAVDGRRILADIVLAYWPVDFVQFHLSDGATFSANDGQRVVAANGQAIIEINATQVGDREAVSIANFAQNYELSIVSKRPKP